MKKAVVFLWVFLLIFSAGCNSYSAYKDYYSDPKDYLQVWQRSGFYNAAESSSPLFPKDIDHLDVVDFMCRYDEQLPIGEGVQLYLKIQYKDQQSFDDEVDRIASVANVCNDAFDETNFDAYVMRLCEELVSEYALVDDNEQTVSYLYLKNIPKSEIEIDHTLLPKGYSGYGELG